MQLRIRIYFSKLATKFILNYDKDVSLLQAHSKF